MKIKRIIQSIGLLSLFALAACGSSGTSTSADSDLSDEQAAVVYFATLQMASGITVIETSTSESVAANITLKNTSFDCNTSGSFEYGSGFITYNNCIVVVGDTQTETDGSISLSGNTITWDTDVTITTISTSESSSSSISGTVTEDPANTYTADWSGTYGDLSFDLEGTLTYASFILDGTVNFTITSGSNAVEVTCTFVNLDTSTATSADYSASCSVI